MSELHYLVEESPEGGYLASAVGVDLFTEADDLPALRASVRDAVACHFEPAEKPSLIRLHFIREQALAASGTLALILTCVAAHHELSCGELLNVVTG